MARAIMNETVYDWLAAREAIDARSRSQELAAQFAVYAGRTKLTRYENDYGSVV